MNNRNRNRQDYSSAHNENRPYRSSHIDERRDWYERDMMDERSGYRSENAPRYEESRRNRNRDRDRDFDTDQSLRGNTYDSERWAGTHPRESSRDYSTSYSRDYNRDMPQDYTTTPLNTYGSGGYYRSHQVDHVPERRDSSFAGRGPKNYKRSDERIREEVCEMLTRHHDINAEDIEVEVKSGEVTLFGTVPERRMKYMAEDVAERCFGVTDVTNNIRIKREDELGLSRTEGTQTRKTPGSAQNPSH